MNIALKNLIENNCKYSANHTSNVLISAQSDNISITLSDTGAGMTAEEQRNIFLLFYRGTTTAQKGHGIGMALVHKIITLHKGKIEVKSKSGHGTTFRVKLPKEKFQRKLILLPFQIPSGGWGCWCVVLSIA